ncbi:DUF4132 domain-containing protein [Clostridiales bacterium COT073_COT-073]|nr:DUF4132 domain-containing protein [Clostridiales bacterium COT073_COT-073]
MIEEILYTDDDHSRKFDFWQERVQERLLNQDFCSLSDIFPEEVYPALDLLIGKEFRHDFLKLCERMLSYPYTEGYYRKMIRSGNYRQHFYRIGFSYLPHFITCHIMNYDISSMIHGEFQDDVKQQLAEHYAMEIDNGNLAVIETIKEMLLSENNTAILSYYVVRSIFMSSNQELLELLEKLLLAAKLQEGLRQVICENMDSGLQENFVHFFDVIYENNLMRFSSVKRAIATFTGLGEEFGDRITQKELELIQGLNHGQIKAEDLIGSEDNVIASLGLWKKGSEDVTHLLEAMQKILKTGKRHSHLMVSYYLNMVSDKVYASQIAKQVILQYCLNEQIFEQENGLEFLACYHYHLILTSGFRGRVDLQKNSSEVKHSFASKEEAEQIFTCLERALLSMKTKEQVFSPCIFPWYSANVSKYQLARNMAFCTLYLQGEYIEKMTDYIKFLEWDMTEFMTVFYAKAETKRQKDMLITLLGDRNVNTKAVYKIIRDNHLAEEYIEVLEGYLRLKTPEIRQSVIELIYSLPEDKGKQSIQNLLAQKDVQKRLGGLDLLLKWKKEKKLSTKEIKAFVGQMPKITTAEQVLIDTLLAEDSSLANDLYDADYQLDLPVTLTAEVNLQKQFTKSADELYNILKKLNDLVIANGDYEYQNAYGSEVLLRNSFASMEKKNYYDEDKLEYYPLAELWLDFYHKEIGDFSVLYQLRTMINWESEERSELDELDKIEAELAAELGEDAPALNTADCPLDGDTNQTISQELTKYVESLFCRDFSALGKKLGQEPLDYCGERYNENHVFRILDLLWEREKKGHENELIALAKTVFAQIMKKYKVQDLAVVEETWSKSRYYDLCFSNISMLEELMVNLDACDNDKDFKEIFSFKYHLEKEMLALSAETGIVYEYTYLHFSELVYAIRLGILSPDAFYQKIFSNMKQRVTDSVRTISSYLTGKLPDVKVRGYNPFMMSEENINWIKEHGKKAINYLIALELKRGDMPLPYSAAIHCIDRMEGMDKMIAVLKAMGNLKLDRNSWYWNTGDSKASTLSHLLKVSYPLENDQARDLKKLLKGTDIIEQRLTEVAMYSPQWIPILEEYLGWKGMASGCYYFHAHTSDADKKKEGLFAKYTPISIEDLKDGAFDVDWFKEAYQQLGDKKFEMLYESAKYISDGAKHGRARKFADAVLGKFKVAETEKEITAKRNKDLLASYGLIPLAKNRKKDLLRRYQFLQKFLKESRQFGAQRRASEAKAFQIALENLSRNAGYADATRLIWTMETELIDSMKEFFVPKAVEDISAWIQIRPDGQAEIHYEKAGKELKSLPAKLKKDKYIETLKEIQKNLKEQYSRSKKMLEAAMEEGTTFTAEEIDSLMRKNPVIAPLLKDLVMKSGEYLGYYLDMKLLSPVEEALALKGDSPLVIAHALDLFQSGNWHEFQKDLFESQIKQPFKQVFRELYVKTEDELGKYDSLRYAGHQIQPQKTVAVLKTRRWVIDGEEGLQKVYYKQNLIARIYALADWYSPADIEAPTLEWVQFFDRKNFKPVLIDQVPDLIFTEVMRDVDLAVSIAHVGGVDPEASHSTMEMRRAIIEFNLPLFKLQNVSFTDKHALIKGKLAEYSIHLGSGLVHQKAGAVINVLPVHAQQRGKIFLPFIDEDPKTAEIMSKVLLFAKDEMIKDTSILDQIKVKKEEVHTLKRDVGI